MSKEFCGKDIIIMSCSDCNTRCKHCYISYTSNFEEDDLFELASEFIAKFNTSINGSELLIHPEYFKTIQMVGQTRIMTNGIEIVHNPEMMQTLKSIGIKTISISYHMGIHDEISLVREEIVYRVIKIAKQYSMKVRIMVTIDRDNYLFVESMCKRAIELGANSIRFTNYLMSGNALEIPDKTLSDEQIQIFLSLVQEQRKKYAKDFLEIKRCGTFGRYNNNEQKNNFVCPAGKDLVAITPDMNVYPCNFLSKIGFEIGKVVNGKVIIYKKVKNDGLACLAHEIYNKHDDFSKYFE